MTTWDSMSDVDRQHMRDAGRDEGGRHLGPRPLPRGLAVGPEEGGLDGSLGGRGSGTEPLGGFPPGEEAGAALEAAHGPQTAGGGSRKGQEVPDPLEGEPRG
jgi:hypothetical protein